VERNHARINNVLTPETSAGDGSIADDEDDGHVIVSLSVDSDEAIAELDAWRVDADDKDLGYSAYRLGTISFEEPDCERRADALRAAMDTLLDRLANVSRRRLNDRGTLLRLYVTVPSGAETISAKTVARLAEVNAALWIDE
jgi:hypothetical protein